MILHAGVRLIGKIARRRTRDGCGAQRLARCVDNPVTAATVDSTLRRNRIKGLFSSSNTREHSSSGPVCLAFPGAGITGW